MIHSPVSEQTCCTLPLIQIIFHWSLQELDFLTFSSSPKWSQCGFLLSLLRDKTLRKKSNQTFFFFSQSEFLLFFQQLNANALQLKPVRLHHRQTDWLHPADTHAAAAAARGAWRLRPFLSTLFVTRPGAAAAPESAELRWDDRPTLLGKKRWKDWANSKLWAPVVSVYRVAPNHQLQQNQSDFQRSAILSFS